MRTRRFVDPDGRAWQAFEISALAYDEAHARFAARVERPVLYFVSRDATRRTSDFPDDWSSLPSPQLATLCERAQPIQAEWKSSRAERDDSAPHVL